MEREVGGGFKIGNTCKSMDDSCQCMAKTTTIYKRISLHLIKINEKIKSRDVTLPTKGPYNQSYGFSSSHVWM